MGWFFKSSNNDEPEETFEITSIPAGGTIPDTRVYSTKDYSDEADAVDYILKTHGAETEITNISDRKIK